MKEIQLIGIHRKMCEKLKAHIGQKICQYYDDNRYEWTLISVDDTDDQCILLFLKDIGTYMYIYSVSSPLFLCIEEDEVLETFEEMVKRKQENIFRSLK